MSATLSSAADAVRRFWDRYLELLHKQGIKPPADRWYVIRAEAYIKANPERRLLEHTPADIHRHLSDLGKIGRISDWQFRQSVDYSIHTEETYRSWTERFQVIPKMELAIRLSQRAAVGRPPERGDPAASPA